VAHDEGLAAGEPLSIDVASRDDGQVHVTLTGELDTATVERFAGSLAVVEAEAPAVLVIDLRGLTFMDSAGLRELFQARRRASAADRRLVLVKGSDPIDRVLEIVRADSIVETVEDPADVN
jgi:RND superfamily putative drug exporter